MTWSFEWYALAYALLGVGFFIFARFGAETRQSYETMREDYGQPYAGIVLYLMLGMLTLVWPATLVLMAFDRRPDE